MDEERPRSLPRVANPPVSISQPFLKDLWQPLTARGFEGEHGAAVPCTCKKNTPITADSSTAEL